MNELSRQTMTEEKILLHKRKMQNKRGETEIWRCVVREHLQNYQEEAAVTAGAAAVTAQVSTFKFILLLLLFVTIRS